MSAAIRPKTALGVQILDKGLLATLLGRNGLREVEIGRGSSDVTYPVVALQTWPKLAKMGTALCSAGSVGKARTLGRSA